MKRLLTTAAITFGLLTGIAAHAAPTCHQKVIVAGLEYLNDTVPVSTKVSKMVREQALDLISSSTDDYNAKAVAYVTAVAAATADVMKAAVTDEIKDLAVQTADTMVTSFGQTDKFQKDPHVADVLKNAAILDATSKIITAFFACKPTLPLPGSAMAVESPKDTAKAVQPEDKAERAAVPKTSTVLDVSSEATAKMDSLNRIRRAHRIETPAAKGAIKKASKFLFEKVRGRSCDDEDAANPTCLMEDGTSISVEAVPLKLSQAEADAKCASDYVWAEDANASDGVRITMADLDKAEMKAAGPKFKLLWCTYAAQDWSTKAAENRIKWDGDLHPGLAALVAPEVAEYKVTTGKMTRVGRVVYQAVSVKNNTRTAERQTFIECAFFLKGELVGTGLGAVGNLMPGMTKHTSVVAMDIDKTDKVECNVQ